MAKTWFVFLTTLQYGFPDNMVGIVWIPLTPVRWQPKSGVNSPSFTSIT